ALTNSEPFRRFHAFLKLLVNPFDNFSFLLIKDVIGISREEYSEFRVKAAAEGKSHFQVYMEEDAGTDASSFFDNAAEWTFEWTLTNLAAVLDWPFDITDAANFAFAWQKGHPNGTLTEYLAWLATYDIQDEIKSEEEVLPITLMTIHAAKGLEWPVVIVAGCNEGIIPSKQALKNGEIEAERRLMYVAMTRAREQLILTIRPEVTETEGRVYESPRSRFIGEAVGV
ncbi:MAG: ATP-dependent helicase, partial [Syntrophales bacterium]|nr:ATP-dependent helicase [Syntrophales bacterium]